MNPIGIITSVSVILLIGVLLSAFAKKTKIPDIFFLILFGVIIGSIQIDGIRLIDLPSGFLESIGILALAMIVFDSSSNIKIKLVDAYSTDALKLVWTFLVLDLILFSILTMLAFPIGIWNAILFASIMCGTSPAIILPLLKKRTKLIEIVKLESLLNTPLTVLLPFLIIDLSSSVGSGITSAFYYQLTPFLTKFVGGIGAGMLIGIVLFKVVKKAYSKIYSPLAVVIAALLAYVLAENLGGNGVLAVTTLGIFFGTMPFKQKFELMEVESLLAKSLYILLFILLGTVINVPFTINFFLNSIALFIGYLLIRYIAVHITFRKIGKKEKWFMTLLCSKGIAVAVVAFSLAAVEIVPSIVLDLTLVFILYSIIVSSIASYSSKKFFEA